MDLPSFLDFYFATAPALVVVVNTVSASDLGPCLQLRFFSLKKEQSFFFFEASHLFDSASLMSFDQEALGMGWSRD